MKKYRKRQLPKKRKFPVPGYIVLVLLLGITIAIINENLTTNNPELKHQTRKLELSPYSDVELHDFWDTHLKTLVQDQWAQKQLPYTEINDRHKVLAEQIFQRTGKSLTITMSTNYHWLNKFVLASASYKTASFELYIPSLFDGYKELERTGHSQWRELFESQQIITLMHELEHTANGVERKQAVDIVEESRAWAETCRYTIAPLVEIYKVPIHTIGADLYKSWKKCGGDTNSLIWTQAMNKHYGQYDGITDK